MDDLIPSLRAILLTTRDRWQSLAATVPPALMSRPAAPDQWSAIGCLQHLVDTERWVFPVRVRNFLAGEDIAAFDPDRQRSSGDETPAQLVAEFARLRDDSLALLDTVTGADLARSAVHAELGRVALVDMLHEWAAHDLNHTIQAERALMQPFIAGCGPWRHYFAEHDLSRAEV